jgi:hypothetical protein
VTYIIRRGYLFHKVVANDGDFLQIVSRASSLLYYSKTHLYDIFLYSWDVGEEE